MKVAFSRFDGLMEAMDVIMRGGISRFEALVKAGGYESRGKGRGSYSKRIRSGKVFPPIGAKQAERNQRQGLRNVNVNGFSLIQRG